MSSKDEYYLHNLVSMESRENVFTDRVISMLLGIQCTVFKHILLALFLSSGFVGIEGLASFSVDTVAVTVSYCFF